MARNADKTYTYSGPLTGATLEDGREVMLHPGQDVLLPPDDRFVATLVGMGRLKEKQKKTAAKTEESNAS